MPRRPRRRRALLWAALYLRIVGRPRDPVEADETDSSGREDERA